jgi:ABC-type multidrug transport system ATPase subunit
MNGMCGFSRISSGQIVFENEDLYKNYDALKNLVGYVPQQDIVHKDLTLYKMLYYTARMRMPVDTDDEERRKRIADVIEMVELGGKEDTLIKSLSGGQRKRASIAVELISDPTVFFLDEPSSGLDPGTERNLMYTLKNMTKRNKTVVVITHMTLNIGLCDKLIILGYGGRLCFFGTPDEALQFFGVQDFVDIYDQINTRSADWQQHFRNVRRDYVRPPAENAAQGESAYKKEKNKRSSLHQLGVLCARYLELTTADKKKLLILMLQAPLLGLLLTLVSYATDMTGAVTVFTYSGEAKAMLFSLSCAAFWIGMLNAVQEICKERDIFNRERLANLKLMPYLLSKLIVLGGMCMIQSLTLIIVVGAIIGFPEANGFGVNSVLGMYFTTFLTAFSAAALGLAVSSVSPNPDRAMTIAPIVLMPQILFSGIAFQLTDFSAFLSGIFNCRWSVRAFCILANINGLPADADATGTTFENVIYSATFTNFIGAWGMLLLISVVCLAFSCAILAAGTNE